MKSPHFAALLSCMLLQAFAAPNQDGFIGVHKTQSAQTLSEGRLMISGYTHITDDERLLDGGTLIRSGVGEVPDYFLLENNYVSAVYGLSDAWDVGLNLPFYFEEIATSGYKSRGYILGDAKAQAKYRTPWGGDESPYSLAALFGLSAPTAPAGKGLINREMEYFPRSAVLLTDGSRAMGVEDVEAFVNLALTGELIKSEFKLPLAWHLNAGFRKVGPEFGDSRTYDDVASGSAALEWRLSRWFELNGEFYHEARFDNMWTSEQWKKDPTTLTFGAVGNLPYGASLQAGVMFGILNDGATSVNARDLGSSTKYAFAQKATVPASLVFGISWNGQLKDLDWDKDGIPNLSDKCPNEPEDKDGFQDADGCPDPDNDKDGICDPWVAEQGLSQKYAGVCKGSDKCPNEAEDFDGYQDADGCPDPDNDKDGIPDAQDKCPNQAQGADGKDGCPNLDHDNDGIPDSLDKCPNEPEDKDGFEDADGCPDPDNDKDGICDPWVAEQGLSQKYAGVCKGSDKCPNDAETMNGYQDEDGCPDQLLKKGEKLVLKGVFFKTASAELTTDSYATLDSLAVQLKAIPEAKLEVQGHTDNIGNAAKNKKLSAQRAESVVKYLAGKGVDKARLQAKGYGSEKPVGDNKTATGRSQNRRVELLRVD